MRWIKHFVLTCALVASSLGFLTAPASATSQYDNVVSSVSKVKVVEGMSSCSANLTTTWDRDMRSFLSPTLQSSYDAKVAWGVSLQTLPSPYGDVVVANVYWWEAQDLPDVATFDGHSLQATPTHRGSLQIWHNGQECQRDGFGFSGSASTVNIASYDPNTSSNLVRPYVLHGIDVDYPLGYAGELVGAAYDPPTDYVAMGDSYSSGEGVLPYESGSDTGSNSCHRSSSAYPRLVQSNNGLSQTSFVACSGAVSDYIINSSNQENAELPQAIAMSEDTDLVTISIGGNDVGFPDVMKTCVGASTAQDCLDAIEVASDKVSDPDFLEDITDVLRGVRALGDSNTEVIALGYPNLFPAFENLSGSCKWGTLAQHVAEPSRVSNRTITEDEINALRQAHDDLNDVIMTAVINTFDSHVYFADPSTMFAGHEICGGLSTWINDISLTFNNADVASGSYHPNADGQAALADIIQAKIANFD